VRGATGLLLALLFIPATSGTASELPAVDTAGMETRVAEAITRAMRDVRESPAAASAWGHLAQVLHAHNEIAAALPCYRQASVLAPGDFRWPYLAAHAQMPVNPRDALQDLERASELAPDNPRVLEAKGKLLMRLGEPGPARRAFERALGSDPGSTAAQVGLARLLMIAGDIDGATRLLQGADARSAEVNRLLAQVYRRAGKPEAASAAALRARAYPETPPPDPVLAQMSALAVSASAYEQRGREYAEAGRLPQAEAALRQVLAIRDGIPADLGALATVLARQGKFDEAFAWYERALRSAPDDAVLLSHQGLVLLRTGRISEAGRSLERAVHLDPAYATAQFNLGVLRYRQSRHEEAIAQFRRALDIDPTMTEAWLNLGSAQAALGRLADALEAWEQLRVLQPHNVQLIENIALARARVGEYEAAAEAFSEVLTLAPNNLTAYRHRALALANLGRHRAAETELQRAIDRKPEDPAFWQALADVRLEAGDLERAASAYRRVTALVPDHAAGYYGLGRALLRLGSEQAAIDVLEQGLALAPKNPELMFHLGDALLQAGRTAAAIEHLERALYLEPRLEAARYALAQAYRLTGQTDRAAESLAIFEKLKAQSEARDELARLEWVARQNPDNALSQYNVATAYARLDRVERAIERLQAALRLAPDMDEARWALARLRGRNGR
jgi:tetratricopeptide (TPR) repeat protein